jgi:hypothetical protein
LPEEDSGADNDIHVPVSLHPMTTRARDGITQPNTRHADYVLIGEGGDLNPGAIDEPASFAEAQQHEAWRHAMLDEHASIEENNTWALTDLPAGHRPIGLKWVFKTKRDARHKARLVAKGYVQREGVDFDEVFATVAPLDSVRLLVAIAAQQNWPLHHLDVKSAFLNGTAT